MNEEFRKLVYYINTSEIPSEPSGEKFISSHVIFPREEITVVMVT